MQKSAKKTPTTPPATQQNIFLSLRHKYSGKQEGNKTQETEETQICGCEAVTRGSVLGVTDHTIAVQLGEEQGTENPLMNVILVKRRHKAHAVPKENTCLFPRSGPRPYENTSAAIT